MSQNFQQHLVVQELQMSSSSNKFVKRSFFQIEIHIYSIQLISW